MRKASFILTKAIVRWQLLRCRTVQDERHCLAGARGHRTADRRLLLLHSRYSKSTLSLCQSVWPCLPRLQTQLFGHWSRTKRVGQFGRGSFDMSARLLNQRSKLEIMSLYAVFVCCLSIKMMHYGGWVFIMTKNLTEWLLKVSYCKVKTQKVSITIKLSTNYHIFFTILGLYKTVYLHLPSKLWCSRPI